MQLSQLSESLIIMSLSSDMCMTILESCFPVELGQDPILLSHILLT